MRIRACSTIGLRLAVTALLAVGCSGDVEGSSQESIAADAMDGLGGSPTWTPPGELTVDTGVSDDSPPAGEPIEVFCSVSELAEGQPPPETHWEIYDHPVYSGEGPLISGNVVTFETSGIYQLRCVITETGWVDPTATKVWVRPAAAVDVDTVVTPDVLVAGEVAEAECSGADVFGNVITSGWELQVTPAGAEPGIPGGLVASGMKVKALNVGSYDVACSQPGGGVDETPSRVWVEHALPHRLVTTLGDETIEAGGSTSVTCHAEDKWGNLVPDLPMTVALPSALSMTGFDVTGTLTGKYAVKCVPAALEWTAFDLVHAPLEVLPGEPVSMALEASPPAPFYPTFTVVEIVVVARDIYDNLVPDAEIDPFEITPEGTPATNPSGTNFIFLEEGLVTLTTRLVIDPTLEASIELLIEGEPPNVAVTYPLRGATIQASKPSITVEGIANDSVAGIVSVLVNGEEASLH